MGVTVRDNQCYTSQQGDGVRTARGEKTVVPCPGGATEEVATVPGQVRVGDCLMAPQRCYSSLYWVRRSSGEGWYVRGHGQTRGPNMYWGGAQVHRGAGHPALGRGAAVAPECCGRGVVAAADPAKTNFWQVQPPPVGL